MIPRTREALSELLARTFPHTQDIDPATLDAFVEGLMRARTQPRACDPARTCEAADLEPPRSLFRLRATHARRTPITSVFTGTTYTTRVRLPDAEPADIATPIGTVRAEDHLLLGAVVRADGEFDRLERIEVDWTMNCEVPSALGNAFRFSDAATREYEAIRAGTAATEGPAFERRLAELEPIVARLPDDLREQYTRFVVQVCAAAAEASGGWLWFGSKVGDEEKRVLNRLSAALRLGSNE